MRLASLVTVRAALLGVALVAPPVAAQAPAPAPALGGFVITVLRDTVYLERYAAEEGVVAGEILRVGEDVTTYAIRDGALQVSRRPAPPAHRDFFQPFQLQAEGFGRYPILVDGSIGMLEHLVRRVVRDGQLAQRIGIVLVAGRELDEESAMVTMREPGYAEVALSRQRLRFVLQLDGSGRVVRGAETTRGWTFERVPDEWLRQEQ